MNTCKKVAFFENIASAITNQGDSENQKKKIKQKTTATTRTSEFIQQDSKLWACGLQTQIVLLLASDHSYRAAKKNGVFAL